MTDQFKKHTGPTAGSLLDHADKEAELSALMVAHFREAPTVHQAARQLLADALVRITRFPNPDALFIHANNAGGLDPAPLSLTEVLLRAFVGDTTHLDDQQAALSTRRDSAHTAYAPAGLDIGAVREMLPDLLKRLPGFFTFSLDQYWAVDEQTFTRIPGEDAFSGTREEVFETLQSWVLGHAIGLAVGTRELTPQEEERLLSIVDSPDCMGRYALSLRTSDGSVLPLIGTCVATAEEVDVMPLDSIGPDAVVYLFSPSGGVEKFATLDAMELEFKQRLAQTDSRDLILGCLSLEHQMLLNDVSAEALDLDYSLMKEKPAARFIASLREKQLHDFDHLLAHAPLSSGDPDALLQMFEDVSRLDDLEQALNARYMDLLAFVHERRLPQWLRFAAPSDRQRYETLAAEQSLCEARMQAQLVGIETPEVFARKEIAAYLMKHLGYTLDPSSVTIHLPDEMQFADAPLKTVYTNTLLGFALDGMPETDLALAPSIEVDATYAHVHLNFEFVCRLVRDLNVKQRYGSEVERRYRDQTAVDAMSALRASNIALSAWAAKLQGHLSDRGLALIEQVQSNLSGSPAIKLGGLYLKGGNRRLEDVVAIREVNGDDEFYVLYAPGQPNGREMFDFDTWRKLSLEVGSWTGNARGAQYLLDQTVVKADQHVVPYIESIQLMPSQWSTDSLQFVAVNGASFTDALSGLSHYKIEQMLARNQIVASGRMQHVTEQHRMAQVVLTHRIAALNKAYDAFGITPWRQAARRECERLIDRHLKASGVPGRIDPDTVFFDVEGNAGEGEPDFGRYTTLKCLTDLFMVGYSEEEYDFDPDAAVYSSIGQDVSALTGAFVDEMIRGSNYADEYIKKLRQHTLGLTNSPPPRARALFARKTHCELRRDALIEYAAGRLDADHYNWLVRMITSLDSSIVGNNIQAPGTLHLLIMEYKTFATLYVFKPDKANARLGTLVYTPGAPDGYLFRQEDDVVRSVSRPGMSRYYYDQVYYGAQRIIGTLMQKLEVSPVVDGKPYKVSHSAPVTLQSLHGIAVQHLIVDIDTQTESVNERRLLNTYTFVRKYGGQLAGLNPMTKLVWTALHASVDLYRGIHAYQDGDRARARGYFMKAALGAFKTARQIRKIRKAEKVKRLGKTAKLSSGSVPRFR